MNKSILVILVVVLVASCTADDHSLNDQWLNNTEALLEHNAAKISIPYGFAGTLIKKEGNCMPITSPTDCINYPIKGTLEIYEYTHFSQTVKDVGPWFDEVNTTLIKRINTDSEGFFQVVLDPDQYSVFIMYEGRLYANGGDGQGGISPFVVNEGEVTYRRQMLDLAAY